MDNRFTCLACGADFGEPEAGLTNQRCPDCGTELVEKEEIGEVVAKNKQGRGKAYSIIFVLLCLVVAITLFWRIGTGMVPQTTVDEILDKALEVNSKVPLMIDKSTRLDLVEVEDKTIIYKTTLVNLSAKVMDKDESKRGLFKKKIVPFLAEKYCNDENSRKALELGVKYGHEYFGNNGALLYTANISVDDC